MGDSVLGKDGSGVHSGKKFRGSCFVHAAVMAVVLGSLGQRRSFWVV